MRGVWGQSGIHSCVDPGLPNPQPVQYILAGNSVFRHTPYCVGVHLVYCRYFATLCAVSLYWHVDISSNMRVRLHTMIRFV